MVKLFFPLIKKDLFIGIITDVLKIGEIEKSPVYRIQKVSFFSILSKRYDNWNDPISDDSQQQDNQNQHPCHPISKLLNSGSFYFSPDLDLTSTTQKRKTDDYLNMKKKATLKFDPHFIWNYHLLEPLLQTREDELDIAKQEELDGGHILVVLIQGFVGIVEQRMQHLSLKVVILSRLGASRAGTRFNTRGMDDKGNVSNFVETEFIVYNDANCFSFLQIRVFWEQTGFQVGSHKLNITRSQETTRPAIRKHFEDLLERYSTVHIVSLLKQNDSSAQECSLGDAYRFNVNQLKDLKDLIIFTGYDFHANVKRDNYERLSSLTESLNYAFQNYGFFLCDVRTGEILSNQEAVFRVNCLDCLDRTNVVQTVFARQMVEIYFRNINAGRIIEQEPFLGVFNSLWADNGDWLSRIYAGTGALKSSYTRKGKSTMLGLLDDAAKSVSRMYINNFQDDKRQDAIDLLLGKSISGSSILFKNPLRDMVNQELKERSREYSQPQKMTIFIGTFNVNGKQPHRSESLDTWLFTTLCLYPDMYVIGIQELIQLSAGQIVTADSEKCREVWDSGMLKTLNLPSNDGSPPEFTYASLRSAKLVALGVFVYIRKDNVEKIKSLEISIVKTGLGGMAGNKGGIGVSLSYFDTPLVFVTAHLAAGTTNFEERNKDYWTIADGLHFSGKKLSHHDGIFWFGDFNYRINLPNEIVKNHINTNNLDYLLSHDQLLDQQLKGNTFPDMSEGPINFTPTYKYDNATTTYDTSEKARIPSWTDRILYRGANVLLREYGRSELLMSDHRPVRALFDVQVEIVDHDYKNCLRKAIYKEKISSGFQQQGSSNSPPRYNSPSSMTTTTGKVAGVKKEKSVDNLIDFISDSKLNFGSGTSPKTNVKKNVKAIVDPFSDDFAESSEGTNDLFSGKLVGSGIKASTDEDKWWEKNDIDEAWIPNEGDGINPFFSFEDLSK